MSRPDKPRGRASLVVVSKVSPFAPFAPCKMDCLLSGEHDLEKCFAEAVEVGELPASGWPRFDFVLRRGNGTTLCSDHERSPGFFLFLRKDLLAATPMSRADYQWIEAKAGQTGWLFKAARKALVEGIHPRSPCEYSFEPEARWVEMAWLFRGGGKGSKTAEEVRSVRVNSPTAAGRPPLDWAVLNRQALAARRKRLALPALQLQKKVSFQGSEEVIGALDDMLAAKAKAESPKASMDLTDFMLTG